MRDLMASLVAIMRSNRETYGERVGDYRTRIIASRVGIRMEDLTTKLEEERNDHDV